MIERLVICSVNESCADTAELHRHIVQRRTHRSCTDVVGIFRRPADENGVAVGVRQENGSNGESTPCVFERAGPESESNNAGERPERLEHRNEGAFISALAKPGDGEQGKDVEE